MGNFSGSHLSLVMWKLNTLLCTFHKHRKLWGLEVRTSDSYSHLMSYAIILAIVFTLATTIKSNYAKLIDGIKHHLTDIIPVLYQEDLIGEETKHKAKSLVLTPVERAMEVLDAMQARIKSDPIQFCTLLKVLRSKQALCYLTDVLENKQSETGI